MMTISNKLKTMAFFCALVFVVFGALFLRIGQRQGRILEMELYAGRIESDLVALNFTGCSYLATRSEAAKRKWNRTYYDLKTRLEQPVPGWDRYSQFTDTIVGESENIFRLFDEIAGHSPDPGEDRQPESDYKEMSYRFYLALSGLIEKVRGVSADLRYQCRMIRDNIKFLLKCFILTSAAVFFIFMLWVKKSVLDPVVLLKKSMETVAGGDYSCKISLRRNDELQDLATGFNMMAGAIEREMLAMNEAVEKGEHLNALLKQSRKNLEVANKDLEEAFMRSNQMGVDAEVRNYKLELEIERRRSMESDLRESEANYRSIIENMAEGYCELDSTGHITFFNNSLCVMFGYCREEMNGASGLFLLHERDRETFGDSFEGVGQKDYEVSVVRKDGAEIQVEVSISLAEKLLEGGRGLRCIVRNVDKRKRYEEELIYYAFHDSLTGLRNRKAFYRKLDEVLMLSGRYNYELTLIYIDIDRFKQLNDTMGHEAGDLLLKEIASRLSVCLRKTDHLFRIGGDEFTVIIEDSRHMDKRVIASNIVEKISKPYAICGEWVDYISLSAGISLFPVDGDKADTLIKNADAAMYRAKMKRNRYCFFSSQRTEEKRSSSDPSDLRGMPAFPADSQPLSKAAE